MLPPRGCECHPNLRVQQANILSDIFIGLNGVRILSIIAMLLVFASSIFVLVTDVQAVNRFMKDASDEDLSDCDYIEYVDLLSSRFFVSRRTTGRALYQTNPPVSFGRSSTVCSS